MQSVGKQGFLKHSPEGEIRAWVLLEGKAKWSGLERNQPLRSQPPCESSSTNLLEGTGRGNSGERLHHKDRNDSEFGKEALSSTHQTTGLRIGGGGTAGSQNLYSSLSALYMRSTLHRQARPSTLCTDRTGGHWATKENTPRVPAGMSTHRVANTKSRGAITHLL